MPCSRKTRTMSNSWRTTVGARPCDISSVITSRGWERIARASATICCSPPDSVPTSWRRRWRSLGNRSNAGAESTSWPAVLETSLSVSSTLIVGNRPRPSGMWTSPSLVMRSAELPVTSLPANVTLPPRAWIMPEMARRVVVFPAPLAPMQATTSPGRTERVTSRMTSSPP